VRMAIHGRRRLAVTAWRTRARTCSMVRAFDPLNACWERLFGRG